MNKSTLAAIYAKGHSSELKAKIDKSILATKGHSSGLENSTRPLVFMSASGCRASENFDISSENYFFPYMPIFLVMQGKCLFQDISRPAESSELIN